MQVIFKVKEITGYFHTVKCCMCRLTGWFEFLQIKLHHINAKWKIMVHFKESSWHSIKYKTMACFSFMFPTSAARKNTLQHQRSSRITHNHVFIGCALVDINTSQQSKSNSIINNPQNLVFYTCNRHIHNRSLFPRDSVELQDIHTKIVATVTGWVGDTNPTYFFIKFSEYLCTDN